ncbi:MAG: glycosyltransferase [Deltaproteobacteria bacterium]|nr:glycosyltransferase [Deltaproteobacteria bacterium]
MAAVSVIIPTFNRAQKIARAVASVLYQTFADYEILVIDDGSEDTTSKALAPFLPHIQCITHSKNLGVSAARNTGIRASDSPLIAFLDSDDYWLPDKLATQVSFFSEHPEAVACQTEERWIRRGVRVNPMKKHFKPSGEIFEPCLKLCVVSPSAAVVKRSLLEEVGVFDEDFPVCEDYDLWLRISWKYPIWLIPEPLVIKEGGSPDQLSRSIEGMDRYRIRAIARLLGSGCLGERQTEAALKELHFKCRVYGNGCMRRGKKKEGEYYLNLPEMLRGNSMEID